MRGSKVKAGVQKPDGDKDKNESQWVNWPESEISNRELFVSGITKENRALLKEKGYRVIDVCSLPRTNDSEHQYAIEAWLQGMSEGSIPMDKERRLSLELEARARGLLVHRTMKVDVSIKANQKTIEELLKPRSARLTLNRASVDKINHAVEAALIPGMSQSSKIKEDGKN